MRKKAKQQQVNNTMTGLHKYLSTISMNVNQLNLLITRHRLAEWIRTLKPMVYCMQEICLTQKQIHGIKIKEWKTILHAVGSQKQAGIAILCSK